MPSSSDHINDVILRLNDEDTSEKGKLAETFVRIRRKFSINLLRDMGNFTRKEILSTGVNTEEFELLESYLSGAKVSFATEERASVVSVPLDLEKRLSHALSSSVSLPAKLPKSNDGYTFLTKHVEIKDRTLRLTMPDGKVKYIDVPRTNRHGKKDAFLIKPQKLAIVYEEYFAGKNLIEIGLIAGLRPLGVNRGLELAGFISEELEEILEEEREDKEASELRPRLAAIPTPNVKIEGGKAYITMPKGNKIELYVKMSGRGNSGKKSPFLSPEKLSAIYQLAIDGKSFPEIVEETGVFYKNVTSVLYDAAFDEREVPAMKDLSMHASNMPSSRKLLNIVSSTASSRAISNEGREPREKNYEIRTSQDGNSILLNGKVIFTSHYTMLSLRDDHVARTREYIKLFLDGYEPNEIAAKTGNTKASVRTNLTRANLVEGIDWASEHTGKNSSSERDKATKGKPGAPPPSAFEYF